ncbi:MAG: ABC transporter permease [Clostridium sp.]|nr:ABC transporter permease [Clostridium sp.]
MGISMYVEALLESLLMITISGVLSVVFGLIVALFLIYTKEDGLKPNRNIYKVLDFIINVFRSLPFIILMIVLMPLTRVIVGSSIGTKGTIVPLTLAAIPFAARIVENSLNTVDKGIIEASKSFGLKNSQIVFKVMLVEALPNLVQGITNIFINIVAYSAMAGAIGGGGLGALAINYGYNQMNNKVLFITVIIIFLLVQLIQSIGDVIYKNLLK